MSQHTQLQYHFRSIFHFLSFIIHVTNSLTSSINCSWNFIIQPLTHFGGKDSNTFFRQRLCVYDKYWRPNSGPVFLYTGNESPIEVYVNNTGFLWLLAKKQGALIIFAEHRYFGESIPDLQLISNCMSYLTVDEALKDYVAVCAKIQRDYGGPVIAFGGSYGGMLSAWLRVAYPGAVSGAISSSAPLRGFPLHSTRELLDSSARVVKYAVSSMSYNMSLCASNLKAAYVLISEIGSHSMGREMLSDHLHLCSPLMTFNDVNSFLNYLQDPLFNLAEGSYPFPSDYITRALTGSAAKLPSWAAQSICRKLVSDFGVQLSGDSESVKFSILIGRIQLIIDWDVVVANQQYSAEDLRHSGALTLIKHVVDGAQVWYNATRSNKRACVDWVGPTSKYHTRHRHYERAQSSALTDFRSNTSKCSVPARELSFTTAWEILVCNSGLNLFNWRARGTGRDVYWPPNVPRNYSLESLVVGSLSYCSSFDALGLAGVALTQDQWGLALDARYGPAKQKSASNIVFTNGDLDPWSAAGVELQDDAASVSSFLIGFGGHHLDLFWPSAGDPDSVRAVRRVLEQRVVHWVSQKL